MVRAVNVYCVGCGRQYAVHPDRCEGCGCEMSFYKMAIQKSAETSQNGPRKGDWIQTFTGRQFWPFDPRPDEISIIDIAAGLSRECRFGGQCRRFYVVGEHSVLMYRAAREAGMPARMQRAALLHDASEGLGLRDMPRPVKIGLAEYKAAEARVMAAVAVCFDFDWPLSSAVKVLDERIGLTEQAQNMGPAPAAWDTPRFDAYAPLDVVLECWQPDRAFVEFLSAAAELGLVP